jgi:hypothetical protein
MIRLTEDGCFVISAYNCWRPGVYATERAARYAFRFDDRDLQKLQNELNMNNKRVEDRVITFEMLQKLRKRKT